MSDPTATGGAQCVRSVSSIELRLVVERFTNASCSRRNSGLFDVSWRYRCDARAPPRGAGARRTRRGLERNLHDGAQQRLVVASIWLQRAAAQTRGTSAAPLVDHALDLVQQGLAELRDLAHGLHLRCSTSAVSTPHSRPSPPARELDAASAGRLRRCHSVVVSASPHALRHGRHPGPERVGWACAPCGASARRSFS
jgi:hypothetical protein